MALDGVLPIACTNRLKGQKVCSSWKLQRLRRIRTWNQYGSVERALAFGAPPKRQVNRQRAMLFAPHPLPHPHLLLMRRRGAVKRDIGGLVVVKRRFGDSSLGFGLRGGQRLVVLPTTLVIPRHRLMC
jgi:hypothetical protein